jgi:hypothetical protein
MTVTTQRRQRTQLAPAAQVDHNRSRRLRKLKLTVRR